MYSIPSSSSFNGDARDIRILQQVEAYLTYNLDITTRLINSARARLADIESQLITPTAAAGKSRKHLKNSRTRLSKQLRRFQAEVETLMCALDEAKSKTALAELVIVDARRRAHGVLGYPSVIGNWATAATTSQRSSSISSYVSSSSGPVLHYANPVAVNFVSSNIVSPFAPASFNHNVRMNSITAHAIPNAPMHGPITPDYPVSPYTLEPATAEWVGTTDATWYPSSITPTVHMAQHTVHTHPTCDLPQSPLRTAYTPHIPYFPYFQSSTDPNMAPEIVPSPVDLTTWRAQQSPSSDTSATLATVDDLDDDSQTPSFAQRKRRKWRRRRRRRHSASAADFTPPSSRTKSHGRPVSCDLADLRESTGRDMKQKFQESR